MAFGYCVDYLPVTKSVSVPNRPNQRRRTTVSFRLTPLQKLFPFPTDPTNGDGRQYRLGYLPLTKSVSAPNRPNQWRRTTVSFRLPPCYSPCSPSKPKAFQVSSPCLQPKGALYILLGGVHVWGYVPLMPSPSLHCSPPPLPNPCIMILLLQSKEPNSDAQNM
jgi:hypothetical protein